MRAFFFVFSEGVLIALRAIRLHKLRAILTTLGIVIGIVSVTSMFTTINGIERAFDSSMAMLGSNVLYVEKWPWFGNEQEWWELVNRPEMEEHVADAIKRRSRFAQAVAPVVSTARSVQYRDRDLAGVYVGASTPEYTLTNDIELTAGRFYNEIDFRSARAVCIVGADVAAGLFPVAHPIGKEIRIGGHSCEVIGVLEKMGKFLGLISFDTQVQMPLTTFKGFFGSRRSLSIQVKVANEEDLARAQDELTGIVRAARRLGPDEEDNFAINRQEAFRTQLGGVKSVIYAIGIFLTALALLVGGIGVMNIMFVSVKERTREIGIRKAMGATRRAILSQFLMESIMICIVGGIIGIVLSLGVTYLINTVFTAHLSVGTVALAFSICVAVGLIFGFIPARSAAAANPIDALRYE